MIGVVNLQLEAVLPLRVFGPAKSVFVAPVVDTGFTEALALPPDVVADLGPVVVGIETSTLADGSQYAAEIYEAEVEWDGVRRAVRVWSGPEALLGVKLLAGHRLRVDFALSGKVRVRPLA